MTVLEQAADTLRVLGHPQRLRMVELLSEHALTVGELADRLGMAPHACSQHLSIMRAHGILRKTRNGRSIYYAVDHPSALTVIDCIRNHFK